jgi:hypothetical protein
MRYRDGLKRYVESAGGSLAVLTLLAAGVRADAQHRDGSNREVRIPVASGGHTESARLFREIDDPHSGARWLVVRDAANPGGPGRMELARSARDSDAEGKGTKTQLGGQAKPAPMIRPGERLVVEEHSATAEAYLEAVALETAESGATLAVRLRIGGKVIRAVAVAPGRAALTPVAEVRR